MSNTWYFRTIEKYILALLNTFNEISLPVYNKEGVLVKEVPVPIYFGNSDKPFKFNNTTKNLIAGNTYTLPRLALTFNSMSRNANRDTSKYSIINRTSLDNTNKKIQFQFNSVAYDFQFTLQLQTKTLTDALILIEHIVPLFRPSYTIPVFETDIQEEPTSILVDLNSVDLELPDSLEEDEIRIVNVNFPLTVRGNLYLLVKDEKVITKMRLYLDEKTMENTYKSLAFMNFDVVNIDKENRKSLSTLDAETAKDKLTEENKKVKILKPQKEDPFYYWNM